MADIDTGSAAPVPSIPEPGESKGPSLERMTRTVREPTSTVAPRVERREAEPRSQPSREVTPGELSPATRLAQVARAERQLRQRQAQIAEHTQYAEFSSREAILRLPPAERARAEAEVNQRVLAANQAAAVRHVQSQPDRYELVNALNLQSQVHDLQLAAFQRSGRILSFEQVADYLERRLEAQLDLASRTKRAAALRSRALHGDGANRRPSSPPNWNDNRPLTEAERLRRAAAAMDAVSNRRK